MHLLSCFFHNVNGFFDSKRGIRQGDPLFPYPFILAIDFLSINLELSTGSGKIQPFKRGTQSYVSHLLFADDLLMFSKANQRSFKKIDKIVNAFAFSTGLSVNKAKSKIFFSKTCHHKSALSRLLSIPEGYLPCKYLGLPISINYLKARDYSSLIDKYKGKLEG